MSQPEGQLQKYREIVRKRRRLAALSSIPFFIVAAVALLSRVTSGRFLGIPFSVAGPIFYGVLLATFVLHIFVWRCPACGVYLGVIGPNRYCPKCGIRFDAEHED